MNNELRKEIEEKTIRLSTPLDVEKYINAGHISRVTPSSKTKFFIHDNPENMPIELTERIQGVETKLLKDGTSKTIVSLNLKVLK
ncbi:hypothetical protein ACSTJP_10660 [Vibrio parahaemolyticus]|nr:hypothetical protein [Vibrio parahaemolyticus]HCH6294730.1 hypothetical protein [Vibrio parahaemolyticus]HCH6298151.1 hypothetical protein [Vibrio parahaemolyticus]